MENTYTHRYTEKEFEDIQARFDGKAEYDNGFIYLSSNTSITHNIIKGNLLTSLNNFFKRSKCRPFDGQVEVIFQSNNDPKKFKPDVFVMCEDATRKGESFTSSPKLIFEIVSESNPDNDYIIKLAAYQKYGVLEYNIIKQDGHIIQYRLNDGIYHIINTYKKDDIYTSHAFSNLEINLKDIFE